MRATARAIVAAFLAVLSGVVCEVRAQDPVIAAAGDISCDPADPSYNGGNGTPAACRMKDTSDLLVGAGLTAVLLLGDNQYPDGALSRYLASYDPTWGRVKAITKPAPGNHEYVTAGAAGYYAYFGAAAGDSSKGYYAFDLGRWHVIVLNSNCADVGGCGAGSAQEQWLRADLAAHPGVCMLATWHHPRFTSGLHGDDPTSNAFWRALYDAGADLVLAGHDHDYERFAPQDPNGGADSARGIREVVVGPGGVGLRAFSAVDSNSEVRSSDSFGVLRLTLHANSYDWQFVPAAGSTLADSGSGLCHRAQRPRSFYTVTPCRVADTRNAPGPSGGPALAANTTRDFPVTSLCGVPETATSVALNVTVTGATYPGAMRVQASGLSPSSTSTLTFGAGATRANNTIAEVGAYGRVAVAASLASPAGSAHVLLDVVGYFE